MKSFIILVFLLALNASSYALPLRLTSQDMLEGRDTGNVRFYLYSKANPKTPQELFLNDEESVRNSNYDKTRHTKVLIHGWGGTYTTSPNPQVRNAYLLHDEDYNIISVDWYPYSKLNYVSSRAKVPVVGEDVAEFIDFLHDKFKLNFDMLVVIGHSLGAHVAGFTCKNVKRGQVAAIVGLDPAYPLYSYSDEGKRLASTDAKYVQSIQTNGNGDGFLKPIGSASFYPNWGRVQPGCHPVDVGCSHARSVTYYAEAVRRFSFSPMFKCEGFENVSDKSGCTDLQVNVDIGDPLQIKRENGVFYFETPAEAPFGHFSERKI